MQSTQKDKTVKTSDTIGNTSATLSTINPQSVRRPMYFCSGFLREGGRALILYMIFLFFSTWFSNSLPYKIEKKHTEEA